MATEPSTKQESRTRILAFVAIRGFTYVSPYNPDVAVRRQRCFSWYIVILDRDVAEPYGVETKAINQGFLSSP